MCGDTHQHATVALPGNWFSPRQKGWESPTPFAPKHSNPTQNYFINPIGEIILCI